MKHRPLSIRVLAALLWAAPLGLTVELLYLYQVPLHQWYYIFNPEVWNLQVIALAVLTPIVGMVTWTVKPWAYPVLLGYAGCIFLNNLIVWFMERSMTGLPERVVMTLGLLFMVIWVVRREFYAPYFNPRLRWWEQARRFVTDQIRVSVAEFGSGQVLFEAQSFDISTDGIFVVSDHPVAIGDRLSLGVTLPDGSALHAAGSVVWLHDGSAPHPKGFGCRFTTVDRQFKQQMHRALRSLHAAILNTR